jgi:predicted dehydrogenase
MTRTIGVGVIGMGWMGTVHSRAYQQSPNRFPNSGIRPRLVSCADEVETGARQAQELFGFERYTTDWKRLIADPDVEVVNITAPNNLHLEIVRAAAEAGKHIFCEKPVGRGPEETAEIERAARRAGVLTWVGYNYRWAPVVQHARQLIRAGRLGKLTHYRGRFLVGYGSNPHGVLSWRFQRELAGLGTLGDLMSHVIDMAHMIAGPIQRVVANRETFIPQRPLATPGEGTHFSVSAGGPMGDVTNEDYVGVLVRFENGVQGTLEACRIINGPQCEMAFEVNGTQGALSWNFERMNELELYLPAENGAHAGHTQVFGRPEHPFYAQFYPGPALSMSYEDLKLIEAHQFLKSIRDEQQGAPGFAEALAVASVQAAIQRSWETEHWETVNSEQ